jgi:LPS-assembly lipoprotein
MALPSLFPSHKIEITDMIAALAQTTRLVLLALLTMSIVACGFHLRGETNIPARLKVITLTSESGSDNFDRSLRIALNKVGVMVIDKVYADKNTLNLKINAIKTEDTELARDADNDLSQLQRRLSSNYFIRQADGKSVYGPRTINTTKTLTNQNAEESAKLSYNQAQTDSMSDDLAKQLVNDLSYAPL